MGTHPRLESRVSAQERQQTILNARIEELSEDMAANFKQLAGDMTASFKHLTDYQIQTEQQVSTHFDQIEKDIADIKSDLANIKVTMATKDDIADINAATVSMEGRILDAFKQLLTTINQQQTPEE